MYMSLVRTDWQATSGSCLRLCRRGQPFFIPAQIRVDREPEELGESSFAAHVLKAGSHACGEKLLHDGLNKRCWVQTRLREGGLHGSHGRGGIGWSRQRIKEAIHLSNEP